MNITFGSVCFSFLSNVTPLDEQNARAICGFDPLTFSNAVAFLQLFYVSNIHS